MKSFYLAFIAMLMLAVTVRPVQAQSPSPEVPTLQGQKATEPFVGVGVSIPFWKLLNKKKVKSLPELPDAATQATEATESQANTAPTVGATGVEYNQSLNEGLVEIINPEILPDTTAFAHSKDSVASNECTNWYLVSKWSDGTVTEEFLFQSCSEDQIQNGPGGGGGGGNEPPSKECIECRRLQYERHNVNIRNEQAKIILEVQACAFAGYSAGAVVLAGIASGAWWLAYIPQAVIASGVLVGLSGLTVGFGCLLAATWNYHVNVTNIDADLPINLQDCPCR